MRPNTYDVSLLIINLIGSFLFMHKLIIIRIFPFETLVVLEMKDSN